MRAALYIVLLLVLALPGGAALAAAQTDTYLSYFNFNADVKRFTLDTLSLEEKLMFWGYIIELEENGRIAFDDPHDLGNDYFLDYSDEEVSELLAAKYAHAIWIDKNNIVPWNLYDYSDFELKILFGKNSILEQHDRHGSVGDFSPSDLFEKQKHLISDSTEETIYTVLDEYRDTFRHGLAREPLKKLSQDVVSIMDKDEHGQRVSYSGCHSMSKIVEYTLRNFNIPAYEGFTMYGGGGHASIFFPTLGKVALHGDDIYSAGKSGVPFEALMMDVDLLDSISEKCGKDRECNDLEFKKWELQQMLPYVADTKYHVQHCCRRDFGYGSCEEYVEKGFPYSNLMSHSEKRKMVSSLKAVC